MRLTFDTLKPGLYYATRKFTVWKDLDLDSDENWGSTNFQSPILVIEKGTEKVDKNTFYYAKVIWQDVVGYLTFSFEDVNLTPVTESNHDNPAAEPDPARSV